MSHLRRLLAVLSLACAYVLAASEVAAAAPAVGVVGPNVLVRPTDSPSLQANARLVAAGGEFESLQVVVDGGAGGSSGVRVDVIGQLAGPGGAVIPASSVTVYRVGYYDATGLPSDADLGGALGRFPDSLIPTVDPYWREARAAFPIDVPAGENRLAWIDVLVPAGQSAGAYSGASIRVTAADGSVQMLPLSVDVVDLDLPSTTTLDGGFDVNPNRLCAAHRCADFPGGSAGLLAMYEQIALDNRLTLAKPPTPTPSGPTDAAYRAHTRPLLLGTAPGQRLRGARLRTVTIYQWATESADEWRRTVDADGLAGRVRFHCDEVGTSTTMWSACRRDWQRANTLWRGAAAGATSDLPLQMTAGTPELAWARANGFADLADRVSTLIPVLNRLHPKTNPVFPGFRPTYVDAAAGSTAGGAPKSLWTYTSCMSMGCSGNAADQHPEWVGWPSYGVDQPASEARAMGWMAFEYDLAGEYYYEIARDLPSAWTDLWSDDGGNHGDGTLFYPGTVDRIGGTHDVAIESIRLKRLRDGREDHELLLAASRAAGRGPALAAARGAFPSAHGTDVTQIAIEAARASLFGMAAGTAPRATWTTPVTGVTSGGVETGSGTTGFGSTDRGDRSLRGGPAPVRRRTPTCQGRAATIVGTARSDRLRGTPRADVIVALGGNDRIVGRGGADIICAGAGNDLIVSSGDRHARDRVSCATGRDRVMHDGRDRVLRDCERRTRRR